MYVTADQFYQAMLIWSATEADLRALWSVLAVVMFVTVGSFGLRGEVYGSAVGSGSPWGRFGHVSVVAAVPLVR